MNSNVLTTLSMDEKQEFVKKLNQIEFGCIAYKLLHPEDNMIWSMEQITQAIEKYRLFLMLNYLYPQAILVPSKLIDRVWHFHILDTEKYREDCKTVFGYFLDHYGYYGMQNDQDRQALEDSFSETQALWKKSFGVKM